MQSTERHKTTNPKLLYFRVVLLKSIWILQTTLIVFIKCPKIHICINCQANTLRFVWNHDWKNIFSFETIHITNIWILFFTNPNTTCVNPANSLSYIDNTSTMFFTISFSPPLKSQFTLAWLQHFGLPLQTSFKCSNIFRATSETRD